MSTSYTPQFDVYKIAANGSRVVVASTSLTVVNVTTPGSLGTKSVDANGIVAQSSWAVAAGTVIKFSHATYPLTFQITTQATQALAYTAVYADKQMAYMAENLGPIVNSSVAHLYALDNDDATVAPLYLGTVKAGETASIPYQSAVDKNLRIVPISVDDKLALASTGFGNTTNYQDVAVPGIGGDGRTYRMTAFADLPAAKTAIVAAVGTDPATLYVTAPVVHTDEDVFELPANITLDISESGMIECADPAEIRIHGAINAGARQIFTGDGYIEVVGGQQDLQSVWWTGPVTSGDDRFAFDQIRQSLIAAAGGTVRVGVGHWSIPGDFILPNRSRWVGAGYDPDAGSNGTVLRSYDSGATSTVKLGNGFRNVVTEHMCIDTGAITSASGHALMLDGTVTGAGFLSNNVWYRGTVTGQKVVSINPSNTGWDVRSVKFIAGGVQAPTNGVGFHINSVNAQVEFDTVATQCAAGAIGTYAERFGWYESTLPDNGGSGNYSSSSPTSADRTVTASVTAIPGESVISLITLDGSTSTANRFVENDKGKLCNFSGFTGATITLVLDEFTAWLSWHPGSNITSATCTILKQGAIDPLQAYAAYKIGGGASFMVNGGSDESFALTAEIGTAAAFSKVQFNNYTSQGFNRYIDSCEVQWNNCGFFSLSHRDETTGADIKVNMTGPCYVDLRTPFIGTYLTEFSTWGLSDTSTQLDFQHVRGEVYDEVGNAAHFENPIVVGHRFHIMEATYGSLYPDEPFFAVGSNQDNGSRAFMRIGRTAPRGKKWAWDYYYDFQRQFSTGALLITGSQVGFRQVIFDQMPITGWSHLVNAKSDPSQGVGYVAGAGVSVTQATNRNTGVTANGHCGDITTTSDSLFAGTSCTFQVTNSCINQSDRIGVSIEYPSSPGTRPIIKAWAHGSRLGSFYISCENVMGASGPTETNACLIKFWKILGANT